ncbi:MAG: hypothetical protein ACYC6L_05490 [Anaerolineae bacterium]
MTAGGGWSQHPTSKNNPLHSAALSLVTAPACLHRYRFDVGDHKPADKASSIDLARVETDSPTRDEKIMQVLETHLTEVAAVKEERDTQYLDIQITLTAIQKDIAYLRTEYEMHQEASK